MQQGSEAYKQEHYSGDGVAPEADEKKSAVILPFPQRSSENPEEGKEQPIEHTYEHYKTLGGTLNQAEYQSVLAQATGEEGVLSDSTRAQADLMAEDAGIKLSPEIAILYGILRGEKPNGMPGHYSGMSDQRLLAEALRITGDDLSLTAFIEKYPHIFN